MATTTKAMTAEELQSIQNMLARGERSINAVHVQHLLDEVDHQRENYRALLHISTAALDGKTAEVAAMRAILERLANACTCGSEAKGELGHALTCLRFDARAYLASHPPLSGGR